MALNRSERKKRQRKIILVVVVLFAVIGIFAGPTIKAKVWEYRFDRALSSSVEAGEKGSQMDAEEQLRLAWHFSDQSIEQLRAMHEQAVTLKSLNLERISNSLIKHEEVAVSDEIAVLEGLLEARLTKVFRKIKPKISEKAREDPQVALIMTQFMLLEGRDAEALAQAQKLVNTTELPEVRRYLMKLLASARENPFAQKQAAGLINEEMKGEDEEIALQSFRLIQNFRRPEIYFDGRELLSWLEEREAATVQDRLQAYTLLLRKSEAEEKSALVKEIRDQFEASEPDALAAWSLTNGLDSTTQGADTEGLTVTEYLATLQRLVDSKKFADALKMLESPHGEMNEMVEEGLKAGLEARLGNKSQSLFHRNRAIQAAALSGRYQSFRSILTIAERTGDEASAERIAETILEIPTDRLPAFQSLSYLDAYQDHDPAKMLETYQKYHAARPDDPFAMIRYAQLLTVTGDSGADPAEVVDSLYEANPESLGIRATIALIHLSKDQNEAALETLPLRHEGWKSEAGAEQKAILLLVLHRNGEGSQVRQIRQTINFAQVSPFLLNYLKKLWPDITKNS